MNMTKVIYAILALVVAGCGIRSGILTEVVTGKDGRWEYIQTVKDGTVIARYVDTCDDEGVMISRLYLDHDMNVMYYDEYIKGKPAFRYKNNGELWVDFTIRESGLVHEVGYHETASKAKSRDEVMDAVGIAAKIGFEALKMIK